MNTNTSYYYNKLYMGISINQKEAKLIHHIFSRFLILRSTTNLARELNQQGYLTKLIVSKTNKEYVLQLFTKAN